MAFQKRLIILIDSEIKDLYGPPKYSIEEQRLYFALNDDEEQAVSSIRNRSHKCFFIVLLGYFKSKPVAWHHINLNGRYSFSFEQKLPEIEEIMRPLVGGQ